MPVHQITKNDLIVCVLTGRLDSNTVGSISSSLLTSITSTQPSLLLDMSQLEYLSSAGIRLLLECQQKATSLGGKVYLIGIPSEIEAILNVTGFVPFFHFAPSLDVALSQASRSQNG